MNAQQWTPACTITPTHQFYLKETHTLTTHTCKHKHWHTQGFFCKFTLVLKPLSLLGLSSTSITRLLKWLLCNICAMIYNFTAAWAETDDTLSPACLTLGLFLDGVMKGEWTGGEGRGKRHRGIGGFEISSVSLLSLPYQHDGPAGPVVHVGTCVCGGTVRKAKKQVCARVPWCVRTSAFTCVHTARRKPHLIALLFDKHFRSLCDWAGNPGSSFVLL